jgi:hypothetical protein
VIRDLARPGHGLAEALLLASPRPNGSRALRERFAPAFARFAPYRDRAAAFAEARPTALLFAVALGTYVFAFLVNALGSAFLESRNDPLVTHYKDTLQYTSAIVGDGFLIPIANVLVVAQLLEWRRVPRAREVVGALAFGAALTLIVHAYQALNALVNWTMPHPYSWTLLGYTHALFMWAELSLLTFFWSQAALVARLDRRAALHPRLLFVGLCMVIFLRLLLADYGYIS